MAIVLFASSSTFKEFDGENNYVADDLSDFGVDANGQQNGTDQMSKYDALRKTISHFPWKFHHKISVTGKVLSCNDNQQDYFEYCPKKIRHRTVLPLWAIRKVHFGKETLRFTLFVSESNWERQIDFYTLIIGKRPIKVRGDFRYFSINESPTLSIQFSLKRLSNDDNIIRTPSVYPQFEVTNLGHLVPLLPNSCQPISEHRWKTIDHENNAVLLELPYLDESDLDKSKKISKINTASPKSANSKSKSERTRRDSLPELNSSLKSDLGSYFKTNRPLTPHLFLNSTSNSAGRPASPLRSSLMSPILDHGKANSLSDKSDSDEDSILPMPKSMPLLKPELYTPSSVRKKMSSKSSPTAPYKGFSSLTLRPERRRKPMKPEYFDFSSSKEDKNVNGSANSEAVFYV